jgi:hypothetical protein
MTTIVSPNADFIQVIVLRQALKMHSLGMKHSRYNGKQLLAMATHHTGTPYKRGQYAKAYTDLATIVDAVFSGRHSNNPTP